jgi:AcrR family transcriptional regulator
LDKQTILNAGVELAKTRGYRDVFKRNIATVLGCGMGTVNYHWGTMDELRTAIVHEAIRKEIKPIVLQAVALRDPIIWHKNLSPALREKLKAIGLFIAK